mgnify:CR=1 FL=1
MGNMKNIRENLLLIIIITLAVILAGYLITYSYFNKKTKFRAFEECLTTITNEGVWNTRKGTIEYCIEETQK